ncbi:SulP family sulfate permease [Lewinella marina]|uniref:Sodium-independent anion transporter n=1 Tax=Neolewinella marina TaxID=438751 RepID=A0A2G0CEW0_9BACT|nr:SulP family inorganic anion transporter [Neolewinella marina]NJB87213.1 SulP family sulfate permease [Neolewinella marina]PHK98460.1 sodium-independent anion transporter [Neolewinella marina]
MKNPFVFDFSNLRGDFFGGLTAGIVALPLALAFGAQTALGPMSGLYGAIAIAIVAAMFGGTNTQVSGPTAPMTVVSSAIIANALVESGAETVAEALPIILATFFLAGLIEMLFGVIKLGRYIKYIPYPVVSGFMSGIGVIIIITQIFPALGYSAANDQELIAMQMPHAEEVILEEIIREEEADGALKGVMDASVIEETSRRFSEVDQQDIEARAVRLASRSAGGTVGTISNLHRPFSTPGGINWLNLFLALATIAIIYGFKRITTIVPSSLVALIIMTIVAYFFMPGQVPVIGEVQEGLPPFYFGFFSEYFGSGMLLRIIEFAFTLAALGAIDSLLTSVVADNITKTKHDPDQELIGQGLGNMAASFIGGLPGAGATMRTVINVQSGGKTKISGMIAGFFLLLVLLGLSGIVRYIPMGVLAGILITVGIGIIDYKGFRHLRSVPKGDAVVMILVLLLTVFVGLLEAVAIGMVLAAVLFMKKTADSVEEGATSSSLSEFSREKPWADEGDLIQRLGDRVFIKHLEGPLFFGFVSSFQTMVQNLPTVEVVIIRLGRVPYIDQSGLYALEDAIMDMHSRGIAVVFTGMNEQVHDMMERINLIPGLVPYEHCFPTFADARRWLGKRLEEGNLATVSDDQRNSKPAIGENIDEM